MNATLGAALLKQVAAAGSNGDVFVGSWRCGPVCFAPGIRWCLRIRSSSSARSIWALSSLSLNRIKEPPSPITSTAGSMFQHNPAGQSFRHRYPVRPRQQPSRNSWPIHRGREPLHARMWLCHLVHQVEHLPSWQIKGRVKRASKPTRLPPRRPPHPLGAISTRTNIR